ncbi:MAG: adenine phosphoribosyltransferase [Candidatus Poribacteria bacterium]|jgi:adenine phosphoribosyltransferase
MIDFSEYIRDIPDFPEKGIVFKDITPLLGDAEAFRAVIDVFVEEYRDQNIDMVAGIDARGFILGSVLAYQLGIGFVPIRKSGKLPYKTYEESYQLEYGSSSTLAIHQDAFSHGSRVVICDDVIATGGTLAATINLVKKLGGDLVGIAVLIELAFLNGREKFIHENIFSLIEF